MSSLTFAEPRHIYGLRRDVRVNIHFCNEHTVTYPVGTTMVLYDMDQRTQQFLPFVEKTKITTSAMSPNRKILAVAETGENGSKPVISVFDVPMQKRRRLLMCSMEQHTNEYISMAFSSDSKVLIAQGSSPDWNLVLFKWEKGRTVMTYRTSPPMSACPIYQVAINPADHNNVCVVGKNVFKMMRYTEGTFKQFGFIKGEFYVFHSVAFASADRVLVGTNFGRVVIFENGEWKSEIKVIEPGLFNEESTKHEDRQGSLTNGSGEDMGTVPSGPALGTPATDRPAKEVDVWMILAFTRGFVCAFGPNAAVVFERQDDPQEPYRQVRCIFLPHDPARLDTEPAEVLNCMTISPANETLVATSSRGQIYSAQLTSTEFSKSTLQMFELLSYSFHTGPITDMDVCVRKPLMVTCGEDKFLRVWNYENLSLEILKSFQEEVYSVTLHPSGLFLAAGFSDKLRMMNILIDDIRTFKELGIRACKECLFSSGGSLLAAVHGNMIQIYSTITFDTVATYKGHSGKVRGLIWSLDDTHLISCGADGAIYDWEVGTGQRAGEFVVKTCGFTGVCLSPDARTAVVLGTDARLREMSESQIIRELDCQGTLICSIIMSRSGRMLFGGSSNGVVRALKFPLTVPGDWEDFQTQRGRLSKLKLSVDEQYLMSVAEDGTACVWRLVDDEGRVTKVTDKDFTYASEVLVTKADLEEKIGTINELKQRVDELRMEATYQLRLKDMNYADKIKDVSTRFSNEIDGLTNRLRQLREDRENEVSRLNELIRNIKENNEKSRDEMETNYNNKLIVEYDKFQALEEKCRKMMLEYEEKLESRKGDKEAALAEVTEFFEGKLKDKNKEYLQLQGECQQMLQEHEIMKTMIEEDADREILELRTRNERKLRTEKEISVKLRGEAGVLRKKFMNLQREVDDYRNEIQRLQDEHRSLQVVISALEKDIVGLKKEVIERDETIEDKEKRISDLKRKNQELEKFKFVLDYQIKELKEQIEPKEEEIQEKADQIAGMEHELETYHKLKVSLELQLTELRRKLKAADKDLRQERDCRRDQMIQLNRIKSGIYASLEFVKDPRRFKAEINSLYQQYGRGEDIGGIVKLDTNVLVELQKHKHHLESTLHSIQRRLKKEVTLNRMENARVRQENMQLLTEINNLRKELKVARDTLDNLQTALGLGTRYMSANDAKRKLSLITQDKKLTTLLHNRKILDCEHVINQQKIWIDALTQQLQAALEKGHTLSKELPPGLMKDPNAETALIPKVSRSRSFSRRRRGRKSRSMSRSGSRSGSASAVASMGSAPRIRTLVPKMPEIPPK